MNTHMGIIAIIRLLLAYDYTRMVRNQLRTESQMHRLCDLWQTVKQIKPSPQPCEHFHESPSQVMNHKEETELNHPTPAKKRTAS